jgi:hypothetical protein
MKRHLPFKVKGSAKFDIRNDYDKRTTEELRLDSWAGLEDDKEDPIPTGKKPIVVETKSTVPVKATGRRSTRLHLAPK